MRYFQANSCGGHRRDSVPCIPLQYVQTSITRTRFTWSK